MECREMRNSIKLLRVNEMNGFFHIGTRDAMSLSFSGGRKLELRLRQIASPPSLLGGLAFSFGVRRVDCTN